MIKPTYEILNQRGTPMFFSDVFANRPTPGIVGRIFISTDTFAFYRDNGVTWDLIGGPGTGTITGTLTTNYVTKATGTNTIGNSIIYDEGTKIGINTITPQDTFDVNGKVKFQNIRIDGSDVDNTFIGRANWTNNTGTYNTFIGSGAGKDNTTGYAGTFLGYNSGNANTTGIANTFIGYQSGIINTTGIGNTFIGVDAGFKNISSNYNVIIGFHAGLYADVSENVIIGADSAQANGFSGLGSVYVGYRTGFNATSANYNTFIGSLAGFSVTTGDNLTIIGREAGQALTSGSDTTIIGYRAGFNQTAANRNTIIGAYAGFTNGSGNQNTYIGYDSGFNITTGSDNILAGNRSGYNLTTGNQNVFIGSLSGSNVNQLVSATNSISIGYDSFTTSSNQVVIGNSTITHNILYGNLLLGSIINGTQRLQVTGDTLLNGSVRFVGELRFGTSSGSQINATTGADDSTTNAVNGLRYRAALNPSDVGNDHFFTNFQGNANNTTGARNLILISRGFTPTSGTGVYTMLGVGGTINQTGGANGITRGLYVNPTLTAAADWRSIEWSNNTGFGLYGLGSAPNFLNGRLQIGNAASTGESLQVTGTQRITDTRNYSTGAIQSLRLEKNLTLPSGATISTGSTLSNEVLAGTNLFQGSVTIPNSSPFAGLYAQNLYNFSAASFTITSTQSTGVRSLSQIAAQNYFGGSFSGTLTHVSSIQIGAFLNNSTGTITPVITNAYQLLINDINESAHTFTISNRWGIYQEGSNDRNYLAGKTLIGSSTDTGEQFQLTGSIRINNQLSGTSAGNSGQHLIINCDGTIYKIKLENA